MSSKLWLGKSLADLIIVRNGLLTTIRNNKQNHRNSVSRKQNIFTMNSVEEDSENTKNLHECLNATLEEKQKLENMLSSMKAESSSFKNNIESALEELRKINEEIQDIQMKKKIVIRKQSIRQQREQKAQGELSSLCANKQEIENLINAELEISLNERIQQLEECIKYSENHWIFRYFNNTNSETEVDKQETEVDEILQIENKQT
ncbi:hypothetical protein MN116_003958 [Schistosoma mekongi]|uniref:Uncharacterized protein n=1 Tax=Schistosoma mekongi TaxID=38744 RepID=A0AAE2D5Z5_SCHME|nr:hypothetical protein MN116_003958 [Schistosoma mekongi]